MPRREPRLLFSDDIARPRYVWDPHVHQELYGEDCSYFLLRLLSPRIDLTVRLESVVKSVNPSSYCIYKLLGYYDALIRVWLTPGQRLTLIEKLDKEYSDAESLEEFRVVTAFYELWSKQRAHIPFQELLQYRDDIETVSRLGTSVEIPAAEAQRLEDANLLHYLDPKAAFGSDSGDLVKLYIALRRPPGTGPGPADKEITAIRLSIRDVSALVLPSIYTGDGFADYLIKGMVNHFSQIDTALSGLESALRSRGLTFRPLLLLIANREVRESEAISVSWDETVQKLDRLTRLLSRSPAGTRDVAQQMTELSETERDQLRSIFEKFSPVHLDTPFERFFFGIIEARVFGDHTLLAANLVFVLHLEWLLKKYLVGELWPLQLGRDWKVVVRKCVNQIDDFHKPNRAVVPQSERDFDLVDCVRVTQSLIEEHKIRREAIDDRLGPDWERRLTKVFDLQADVGSGKFLDAPYGRDRLYRWQETAEIACGAGVVYNMLLQ